MEWQPIETAPKDGTVFRVLIPGLHPMVANKPEGHALGVWSKNDKGEWTGHALNFGDSATGWMHLPSQSKE